MSFCSAASSYRLPSVSVVEAYRLEPRLFSLAINVLATATFIGVLIRLRIGYHLALGGRNRDEPVSAPSALPLSISATVTTNASASLSVSLYKALTSALANAASAVVEFVSAVAAFPLVFPIYFKYLCVLSSLLVLQTLFASFLPNGPVDGTALFFSTLGVFIMFHTLEQGLLVFLCQRSIGSGAIRRSILYACAWGLFVLTAVLIGSLMDVNADTIANADSPPADPSSDSASVVGVSGSAILPESNASAVKFTFVAAVVCDGLLILYYTVLFILRMQCLRALPWLSSRISAFALARFLFVRRALSIIAIALFLFTSDDSPICATLLSELMIIPYGCCMYMFAVWDSRFWRKLEYITNGPYGQYRSLDEGWKGAANNNNMPQLNTKRIKERDEAANKERRNKAPSPPSSSASSPPSSISPPLSDGSNADSIAPLLKLPRGGLGNLELVSPFLVDFSELDIHTAEPLGVGQSNTAVYVATYRGRAVAVKRIKCDVLTIDVIEQELSEARLLSEISHPNIVQFIGVCIRPPSICLVSEMCQRGSLHDYIRRRRATLDALNFANVKPPPPPPPPTVLSGGIHPAQALGFEHSSQPWTLLVDETPTYSPSPSPLSHQTRRSRSRARLRSNTFDAITNAHSAPHIHQPSQVLPLNKVIKYALNAARAAVVSSFVPSADHS